MPKKPTQKDWSSSIQTVLSVEESHLISLRSRTYLRLLSIPLMSKILQKLTSHLENLFQLDPNSRL